MKKVFHYTLLTLCFLSPLVFKSEIFEYVNFPKQAFVQLAAAVLVIVVVWQWFVRQEIVWRYSLFNFSLGFLLLLLSLSFFQATNFSESFMVWQHWVMAILCFFAVFNGLADKVQVDRVFAALFAAGVCVALIGIAQYLFGWTFVPQTVVPGSTFGNKNLAAQYVMLVLPFGLYFVVVSRNILLVWSAGILTSLMVVFLLYTGTRGAWLACAVELVFFFLFLLRKPWDEKFPGWNRHRSGAVCVSLLLLFILVNVGPQGFQWKFQSLWDRAATVVRGMGEVRSEKQSYSSIQVRKAIWLNTLEMIKDNPLFGVGLGNHKIIYPLYHRKVLRDRQFSEKAQLVQAHNDYLQFVAETGLGGVVFLFWFMFVVCRYLWRLTSAGQDTEVRYRSAVIGMSVAGLAASSCVSFPLQLAVTPFLLMVLVALLAFMHDGKKVFSISGRAGITGLLTVCLLLFVWLVFYHGQRVVILRHYYQLIQLERQAGWHEMLREVALADRYFPSEKRLIYYKAEAHLYLWNTRQAAEGFEEYLRYYPYSINGLRNLGVSYARQGENRKALAAYERYFEIIPDNPAINAYRSRLLRY